MIDYIEKLCEDLDIEIPKKEKDKSYRIQIADDIEVQIWSTDPGFYFHSNIAFCPEQKREDLFIYLMKANLLGQGTGKGRIGIDDEEKFLTMSYDMAYEIKYREFKEKLEDFVNYVSYWKQEIEKHKKLAKQKIL